MPLFTNTDKAVETINKEYKQGCPLLETERSFLYSINRVTITLRNTQLHTHTHHTYLQRRQTSIQNRPKEEGEVLWAGLESLH